MSELYNIHRILQKSETHIPLRKFGLTEQQWEEINASISSLILGYERIKVVVPLTHETISPLIEHIKIRVPIPKHPSRLVTLWINSTNDTTTQPDFRTDSYFSELWTYLRKNWNHPTQQIFVDYLFQQKPKSKIPLPEAILFNISREEKVFAIFRMILDHQILFSRP